MTRRANTTAEEARIAALACARIQQALPVNPLHGRPWQQGIMTKAAEALGWDYSRVQHAITRARLDGLIVGRNYLPILEQQAEEDFAVLGS